MRAMAIVGEFGLDHLKLIERPMPELRHGEVIIRISAVSLNYRDMDMVLGTYPFSFPLPLVPTSDGVGEVVAVGGRDARQSRGSRPWHLPPKLDRWPLRRGHASARRLGRRHAAEYVRLDQQGIVHAPANLSDEEAATLPCAALTSWQSLVTESRLEAGESVLLQGTGGVSLFGLQFATMFGARTIVTSSSDAKLERAKSLGATHTINYVKTPVWHPEVRARNGGCGVDHVIEVGGPESFLQSLQAIRLGGQINMVGYIGSKQGTINPLEILYHRATVRGIPVGSRESFEAMNRAIEANDMHPVIDRVFPWTDAVAAVSYMREGKHFGKIILKF